MNNPTKPKRQMFKSPQESFAARTTWVNGCLIWTGAVKDTGYGALWDGKRVIRPHRWAYEQHHGPIPANADIDHTCGNRLCCNVRHLRVATRKQNMENLVHLNTNNRSGARGVSLSTKTGKWRGRVKHHYREYSAGEHDTVEAAETAVVALRNKLFTHNDADRMVS